MNASQYSQTTLDWLSSANLEERKALGQYMTPAVLRDYLLGQIRLFPGAKILDPAVGTGEFLKSAHEIEPNLELHGWDIDPRIIEYAKRNVPKGQFDVVSALDIPLSNEFDFVIGNPPYFELKLDLNQTRKFSDVISGRINIFALFFKVGIEALKPGGLLAYVVPPSMNNGAYFKALRRFITVDNHIESLKIFSKSDLFMDAQTSVQVITVRKGEGPSTNLLNLPVKGKLEPIIFEHVEKMKEQFYQTTSLYELGYEAVTGNVVWNQHKSKLTNDESDETCVLYYARNITGGEIQVVKDFKKPQYLTFTPANRFNGPAILVNRIIGGVGKGMINAAMVPEGKIFSAENHLNVIRARAGVSPRISISELFARVTSSETLNTARLLTGNTQLSASEWNFLVPFKY